MNRKTRTSLLSLLVLGLVLPITVQAADPDLVGWWKLDDASGTTAIDSSGNGRDGTLLGDPEWVAGQLGGALQFDGTGDAVDLGNGEVFNFAGSFSISVWANIETWNAGNWQNVMVGKHGEGGQSWQLRKHGGNDNLTFTIRGTSGADDPQGTIEPTHGEWHHVVAIYDADAGKRTVYIDNVLDVQIDDTGVHSTDSASVFIGARSNGGSADDGPTGFFQGMIDDVYIFSRALTEEEIPMLSKGLAKGLALEPVPGDATVDAPRDVILNWEPGEFAGTHNLYFGSSFEDVNSATVPTAADMDVNAFDPGRLEFSQTYYWRVDEVNASPDKTVYKGDVWSFEVEPYSYQIPGSTIVVTASSVSNEFSIPDRVIDGSGLDGDAHSIDSLAMWFSAAVDLEPWIQFEFEDTYKMDVMKVWNANSAAESAIGWSVKDVEIRTSVDGENWDVLPGPHQLSRGPGLPVYDQYDTVPLDGVAAKYVRLNIVSNWGGLVMSYGLSEVQFNRIPAQARTPEPASGSVDVPPSATLKWRAGREAGQHVVYIGTDANAVIDGTAKSVTTTTNSLSLPDVDAELGLTYYWRVDEVNDAESISVWAGPVWSLSTSPSLVVDDFESYNNFSPDRPFQTWLDGFGYSADEYFPNGYNGNGTGAGIGHDIWTLTSPYFDGSIMETARTMAGSDQSMPFYYTNSGGVASQTDRTFAAPQDWTSGGAKILSLGVQGQADNTGTLYIKINNAKKLFDGDITLNVWQQWDVDLASLGINLSSVTTVNIGVEGAGASGMVLLDEMRVYQTAPEPAETVSLVNDFDSLAVGSSMHDVPGWEGWFGDAQYGGEVTDAVAYSGTNALEIRGGRDDLVPYWPLVDSGLYEASVTQYVPSSTTSGIMYFAPLRIYGANWDETAWMKDFRTDCGTGLVFVNDLDAGDRTEAPLIRDQWVQLRLVLNFDADTCDFYYGDTHLGTTECPSIQAFDVYPSNEVDVVYFDDFRFESQL